MAVFHSDLRSLLIPSIINQAVGVGKFLPIINLIVRDTRLKDQIRIATNRIKRIILYRGEPLNDTCHISRREMIKCEETTCLFAGNMQSHTVTPDPHKGGHYISIHIAET